MGVVNDMCKGGAIIVFEVNDVCVASGRKWLGEAKWPSYVMGGESML